MNLLAAKTGPGAETETGLDNKSAVALSEPELGTNAVSLRAPDRPLSGSMAFLGHLGLNIVQKSKEKAKNPLNGAGQLAGRWVNQRSYSMPVPRQ